jgi:hypothetical protein
MEKIRFRERVWYVSTFLTSNSDQDPDPDPHWFGSLDPDPDT